MFSAALKAGTCVGCNTPTVVRTFTQASTPSTINIGDASEDRIVVISVSRQGASESATMTVNGAAPLASYNGGSTGNGSASFSIWKVPTGTTASFTTTMSCQPISVYAIYGWSGFKVVQFNSAYLGDGSSTWSFTASPIPANSVIFGTWSSNEDSSAVNSYFNFGFSDRYFYNAGEHDGGTAYEVLTAADNAKLIQAFVDAKRRAYGYLALSCENSGL
jgi:hypothetical protein